ncbi:MAG: hypothetical protein Q7S50_00465 [bacterium]|nr:hypothetical protein [bacterium]
MPRHDHLMIIEQINQNIRENRQNSTLDFVYQRMSTSLPVDRKLVAGFLQKEGGLSEGFLLFVEALSDRRKRYSPEDLEERDAKAVEQASPYVPNESASRNVVLRREDEGIPSALELFFLMLLSSKEWEQICTTKEEGTALGEMSTRNVIENVLGDTPRTKKFTHAVQAEVRKFAESASVVCDAGCGPFPILGLSAALASPRAAVTCIELNPLSARIAQAIVDKFVANGSIAAGQILVKSGDALTEPLPPEGSIDLFISETLGAGLMDEPGPDIFSRFAPCINRDRGSTIPYRAKLSAAVVPVNKGISHGKDGRKITRYPNFVLNTNGTELPVVPAGEWVPLEGGKELPLTDIPKCINGVIDLPSGLSRAEFDGNYDVAISTEFVINQDRREAVARYETFITSPVMLGVGFVTIPQKLQKSALASLRIKFSFVPGGNSRLASKVEVVRRGDI